MKICTKCHLEKPLTEFYKDKSKKDGYGGNCKLCKNQINKIYQQSNKDKIKIYREKGKENLREWRIKNAEYLKKQKYEWYLKNTNKCVDSHNKWRENNPEKYRKSINKTINKRKENDPLFKLNCKIRSMIAKNLKRVGYVKKSRTHEILGCSFEELKIYLESKFEPWMNWENRGLYNGTLNYGWDIDHIIPLASAKTEEELLKLNIFSNLQPLCSYTNRVLKKDNINY